MKIKLLAVLLVFAFVSMVPSFVMAQDNGAPDTVIILTNRPDIAGNDSLFIIEVWVWNDIDGIAPQIGFAWESDDITLDSTAASAAALAAFNVHLFYDSNIGKSNDSNRAIYAGISFIGGSLTPGTSRTLVSTYYFTISNWTALSEIVVDSASWDDGSEMLFVPIGGAPYQPVFWWGERGIHVLDPSDVGGENLLPDVYSLSQNYPNPFNPATTIEFSLEQAGDYSITIFNVIGQVVHEHSEFKAAGSYSYPWDASANASGVYFYRLESGSFSETKKMTLVK